ncbi:MAG TPA: serine hydrolase domain-containing protein [Candidatus Krumholzibacteria bacterium]|nr:serine hydrolase domain-containing protein [Candidatus Krumholzibacteria bacterium]
MRAPKVSVILLVAFVGLGGAWGGWALADERLTADTPKTTVAGNTFVAPAGWSVVVRGPATILEAPEGGSFIALVDVAAADATTADAAVAAAWGAYKPGAQWPLKVTTPIADKDGWTDRKAYSYQTSPNEKRDVGVDVRRANDTWTVAIYDMSQAIGEKRAAQVGLILGKLLPKGRSRESFAGKKANVLDDARLAELRRFVETSMKLTGVPGVSVGIYQNGRVVLAEGFGVRELGKPSKVDADTRYMIASNTKAMATLMLAKLVDEKKLAWDTPAAKVLPSFKLGDAGVTSQVQIKHLICACTGMPRQDLEWLLEFDGVTPEKVMAVLATMQPTSKFGELFQYSNPMAAAAGFLGGHVVFPNLELGAAYDKAMNQLVFDPLGMKATTHDYAEAQKGNVATAHAPDIDGKPALAEARTNLSIVPVRPAGGAWSSVNDMMKYVAMELGEGKLPDGKRYISKEALLARRAPQVVVGTDITYGMGLFVNSQYGTPVVHHGGDMIGFHSDMMWLPEHGVGAVILTNGDPGWLVRSVFRRKLLEVLFDGNAEADGQIAASAKTFFDEMAAERKLLTVPADATEAGKLAARYENPAVGEIIVNKTGAATGFDFGEWSSEVASRQNPDGTISFLTIVPGFSGLEFVVGGETLTLRDAQHEYVYKAVPTVTSVPR